VKIKMLIATIDNAYATLLSDNISERHANILEISVCSTLDGFSDMLKKQKFDVALIDAVFTKGIDKTAVQLPVLLWSENDAADFEIPADMEKMNKHQRISTMVATILEKYAKVSKNRIDSDIKDAAITAFWSPAGGVGKTSSALAYALSNVSADGIYQNSLSPRKDVFYLNLENFSSVPGFFDKAGKSISSVFEMLDTREGNIKMLIQGICCRDKGIMYLCGPENYVDMNILTSENITELVTSCAKLADELVIDLPCVCDTRTEKVFDLAGKVFIVTDQSASAGVKLMQFVTQNDVFDMIMEKTVLIVNKGAAIANHPVDNIISMPFIQSNDMVSVITKLSDNFYGAATEIYPNI